MPIRASGGEADSAPVRAELAPVESRAAVTSDPTMRLRPAKASMALSCGFPAREQEPYRGEGP